MKTRKVKIIEHKDLDIFDPSWVDCDESLEIQPNTIYDVERFLEKTADIDLDIDWGIDIDEINVALDCIVCGSELEGRIDKKFCSHKCSIKMNRVIKNKGYLDPASDNKFGKREDETVQEHIKRIKLYGTK